MTDWMWHLLLTALLSALVGMEREWSGRAAGIRTYMLVGIGSCLVMEISKYLYLAYPDATMDPARLSAQVISGLGFIGAGTIWKSGDSIRGLTTAAGLWVVGIMGLSIGAGFLDGAFIACVLVLSSLFVLSPIKRSLQHGRRRKKRRHNKIRVHN